jgi:ABC-type glycerol-3-phosphate transport system substrate-binding protein
MKLDYGLANETLLYPNVPFVPGTAPIPKGPKGSVPISFGTALGVFENSSNKTEAINFIKYVLSTAGQSTSSKATQCFPITKSSLTQKNIVSSNKPELLKSYMSGRVTTFRKDIIGIESSMWDDVFAIVKGNLVQQQFIERSLTYKDRLDNSPYSIY